MELRENISGQLGFGHFAFYSLRKPICHHLYIYLKYLIEDRTLLPIPIQRRTLYTMFDGTLAGGLLSYTKGSIFFL